MAMQLNFVTQDGLDPELTQGYVPIMFKVLLISLPRDRGLSANPTGQHCDISRSPSVAI